MTKKYLFGAAAGIALLAAGGAAQAADVPQITAVAVTPAAPPVATGGPAFEFTAWLDAGFLLIPCCDYYLETEFEGVVDFQRPDGWGFQFLGWYDYYFPGDDYYLAARAYRDFGALTFGAYVGTFDIFDWTDLEPGFDIEYAAGNLTVYNSTYFHFASFHIHSDTRVEFAVSDRLTAYGELDLRIFDGPFEIDHVEVGAELDLGNITPYAYLHWSPGTGFWGVDIGAEFERQIGTGPLSLIGHADIGIHPGNYTDLEVSIGIRYARGEVNKPWWW